MLGAATTRVLILQTHFASETRVQAPWLPGRVKRMLSHAVTFEEPSTEKFNLSAMAENESLRGRWYAEFHTDEEFQDREVHKWASWNNRRSFWIQREYLLQVLQEIGFDVVLEQYDSLGPKIAEAMMRGYYRSDGRGTFVGLKTPPASVTPSSAAPLLPTRGRALE